MLLSNYLCVLVELSGGCVAGCRQMLDEWRHRKYQQRSPKIQSHGRRYQQQSRSVSCNYMLSVFLASLRAYFINLLYYYIYFMCPVSISEALCF